MKFYKANNVKIIDYTKGELLKIKDREASIIHNDTDSSYICIHELIERVKELGVYTRRRFKEFIIPETTVSEAELDKIKQQNVEIFEYNNDVATERRKYFNEAENLLQTFFDKILDIRANKSKVKQLIKYNRENIFSNMFCFARKLYIGNIIDSEGEKYPFFPVKDVPFPEGFLETTDRQYQKHPAGPKHKIMGVPIKKSTMPNFCKDAAEKLAFDICAGATKADSDKFIIDIYKQYCSSDINVISAVIGISNYKKYIPHNIDYYVKNGLEFDKGDNTSVIFGAKAALIYNYIIAKKRLKLTPINNNTKMKYIYVLPNNEFKYKEVGKPGLNPVNFVAFQEVWPKEFSQMFQIDYETMFRKSFCALFESMYGILGWLKKGQKLTLEESGMDEFFI